MNAFYVPDLAGMIYAMPGMSTHLNLMADGVGSYAGSSANLSGEGFSGMRFAANSVSQSDFDQWVSLVKQTKDGLDASAYADLAKPSKNMVATYYSSADLGLYDQIVMKDMMPMDESPTPGMEGMNMDMTMPGMTMTQ